MRPKYIMNEKEYIENVVLSNKYIVDKDFSKDLFTLIKYYCNNGDENVKETTLSFIDSKSNKENKLDSKDWTDFVDKTIRITTKYDRRLRELTKIPITITEYNILDSLNKREYARTLFTLITLSKFINISNPTESKITYTFNETFTLANMSNIKRNIKQSIIKELKDLGYIDTEVIKDTKTKDRKIVYKCLCSDLNENIVYYIYDISSLGKKYTDMKKLLKNDKIKQCEVCGSLIQKKEVGNIQKYCIDCARIVDNYNRNIRRNRNLSD